MGKKAVSGIMLALLLASMSAASFNFGIGKVVHSSTKTAEQQSDMFSEAPPTEWNKTYGGAGDDEAWSMVQTSDGGYVLAGLMNSSGAGDYDSWLVKTDTNGNTQWNRTYGGTGRDIAYSVVQTGDGGYALAGWTNSYGAGFHDFWLVKTDANGNAQWNKTYGGTGHESALSMVQTGDGGYALAGGTTSSGAGSYDFWLVKTDSLGNHLWNKTYGGANDDYLNTFVQTSDGGYALAGYTYSFGAGDADFWLVKIGKESARAVVLVTTMGNITIELFGDMPITAGNFKNLTQCGIYDGTIFHRVVPGFVIQGGDATPKGITVPPIQDELPNKHSNVRGSVAMAKTSQPNSATSQFYINLNDTNTVLDTWYSVFGRVIAGMDVVDAISHVPINPPNDGRPLQDVTILNAHMLAHAYDFIYIRADGSIDPPTAPIHHDVDIYTFADDIHDSIVVERDNVTIEGNGRLLQGPGSRFGITLSGRRYVTIKNAQIKSFDIGIYLYDSSNNTISGNNITAHDFDGVYLERSSYNTIVENVMTENRIGIDFYISANHNSICNNNITASWLRGISLYASSSNIISGNNMASGLLGVWNQNSSDNVFYGNTFVNNSAYGIYFQDTSRATIVQNNFINNSPQIYLSINNLGMIWDDGYPSGGNYWSDYSDVDLYSGPDQNLAGSDGIWDQPYIINADNQDHYPLVNPWTRPREFQASYSINPPSIDGIMSSEWNDASSYNINLVHYTVGGTIPTTAYFKHDSTNMYIGLKVFAGDHDFDEFVVYFDEGDDGRYGSGTSDGVLTPNQEDLKGCFSPSISGFSNEDGCYKNDAWYGYWGGDFSAKCAFSVDHWECEFSIPFAGNDGGTDDVSDLVCTMADKIGVKIQYFTQPDANNYFYPAGSQYQIETYSTLSFETPAVDEWSFALITDLHIGFGYPDYGPEGFDESKALDDSAILRLCEDYYLTDRLTKIVESINNNPQIKFVVVLGDISDTAEYSEFLKAREILNMMKVPYIPVIGNHDVWPYTEEADQEKELHPTELITAYLTGIPLDHFDPDIRAEKEKRADSAVGDTYFNKIFWEQNNENVQKIKALFGSSWGRQVEQEGYAGLPYIQNYNFTYKGIRFIALDCNAREIDSSGAQLFAETRDWLMENLKENEPTIIFSHHPTMFAQFPVLGTQCFSSSDMDSLRQIIQDSKAKLLTSFGGHTHGSFVANPGYDLKYEVDLKFKIEISGISLEIDIEAGTQFVKNELDNDVVITEAVCRESIIWWKRLGELLAEHSSWCAENLPKSPQRTETNNCIRTVTILGKEVSSYSELDSVTEDTNLRPTSYFTYWPTEEKMSFKKFSAFPYDPDGNPADCTYAWSFGDGQTSSGRTPWHHYKAGEYTASLTVTDGGGASIAPFSRTLTVRKLVEIRLWSPADLIVTDPDGFVLTKNVSEVSGMSYWELDINDDNETEDLVAIWEQKTGEYLITVIPEPEADPTDTYTLEIISGNTVIALAKDIAISDIPTQPYTVECEEAGLSQKVTFNAVWDSVNYPVVISSNSTAANFIFNQSLMQTSFEVSGETGTKGYCNITIPRNLLKGEPWTVKINGVDWNFAISGNATHSFIYFTYTHTSTLQVAIQGTWVIPEFTSSIVLILFIIATLLTFVVYKRKHQTL